MQEIYFAGGCFWGVEAYFGGMKGVSHTEVGYANGRTENPTYRAVCDTDTGYAETVLVRFDPAQISLYELTERFYRVIDPTSLNKQGGDEGSQYRTGIYYTDSSMLQIISDVTKLEQKKYDRPIVVELLPLTSFHKAEEYHQKYLDKNPGGYCHIPKSLL